MADYRASVATDEDGASSIDPTGFSMLHHLAPSVRVEMATPTGGHFLHAAVAMCLFNDTLRLAKKRSIAIDRLRVNVDGNFAGDRHYASTGIAFDIEIESTATKADIDALIAEVVDDASIPRSIQQGTPVQLGTVAFNRRK